MKRLILVVIALVAIFTGQNLLQTDSTETVLSPQEMAYYPVISIIDGDTIIVDTPEGNQTVRLLGIDTPEVDPSRGEVECYGKEASEYTRSLLTDKTVRLETDETQEMFDKYDRLLAYVYLPQDASINEQLVRDGFAREYTYNKPYQYQSLFKKAEQEAKSLEKGLWGCPK